MQRIVAVVLAGLATGAVTQLGQSLLPDGWSQGANAISPWVLVAFLVGSAMPSRPKSEAISRVSEASAALEVA